MNTSIRNFLLFNLLLAIVFITTLSAIGDYYLSQSDVRENMDALLEQMGNAFAIVVSSNLNKVDISVLEKQLNLLPSIHVHYTQLDSSPNKICCSTIGKYYFQLWDNKGNLLLYSNEASDLNLNIARRGLSDLIIHGQRWRVFKILAPIQQMDFIVGERYDLRDKLLHKIALNNLYVMLLTYLCAGMLIWVIIGWGFRPLQQLANEIKNRAPTYLEPVDTTAIPIEIKPLIEALNKLFSRLQEAFEREKRFAGDAAHELRTPLAALKTQAQVIAKTDNEIERRHLLDNMIQSVDRITHIVQQLLTLSRLVPEAASIYDVSEINLSKLSAEIIAQMFPLALAKQIEMELIAPDNTPLFIKGNITGISILIRNLLDNAIRYTPAEGYIKIEIRQQGEHIILAVIDNGPGIPENLHARVFERFYRIVGTTVTGSGLGLAIVKQIADLHQATIHLTTPKSGRGLQFEIWFLSHHKSS